MFGGEESSQQKKPGGFCPLGFFGSQRGRNAKLLGEFFRELIQNGQGLWGFPSSEG